MNLNKLVLTTLVFSFFSFSHAQDVIEKTETDASPEIQQSSLKIKNTRKDFYFGLGIGGGYQNFDVEGVKFDHSSALVDLRVGFGLSEKLLVEASLFISPVTLDRGTVLENIGTLAQEVDFTTVGFLLMGQYFYFKDFYARAGYGYSATTINYELTNNVKVSGESNTGMMLRFAQGYEFRLGKGLAISPEATFAYQRNDGNTLIYGGQANLTYYF